MRRSNHPPVSERNADVVDTARTCTEEHKVTGGERRARRQSWPRVVLLLGGARQQQSGPGVGPLHEPGAVEAARFGSTPDVWGADLRQRGLHGKVGNR